MGSALYKRFILLLLFIGVSVTTANMNNASVQSGSNLINSGRVLVQPGFGKTHRLSRVECSIQTVTEANGKGPGAGLQRALTILNRHIAEIGSKMAKQ